MPDEFKDPTDDAMADLYESMVAVEQQWSGIRDFMNAFTDREDFSDAGFLREARDLVPGLIGNIARMMHAINEVITDADSMPNKPCPVSVQFPNHLPGLLHGCTCPLPPEDNPSKNY